jgi:aldehyde:ferredoxin oxidoreductase
MAERRTARDILKAQEVLGEHSYEPRSAAEGYTGEILRVDISEPSFRSVPVTEQMKDLFVGGRGFDLVMGWQEVSPKTKWDSPENPICISSGPLTGTTTFPGAGQASVTTVSPTTGSVVSSGAGGHFGPLLKFAGFDGLVVVGRSDGDLVLTIDATEGRAAVEDSPLLSADTHLAVGELADMYADRDDDRRFLSTVTAGRGAANSWIGCLAFSWYDPRRRAMRFVQTGRGGAGSVFRRKGLKAILVKAAVTGPRLVSEEVVPCGEGGD